MVFFKNIKKSINRIPSSPVPVSAIYRGWMLKPDVYFNLYEALKQKNITLINSPQEYKNCHYFPETYPVILGNTPLSIWVTKTEIDAGFDYCSFVSGTFRGVPIMIKDYVKSRKHDWNDACYIPNSNNSADVKRVVDNFIRLQDDELNEGIVFREFVKLKYVTSHSISKMPLSKEYRIFYLNGVPIQIINYWDEGVYETDTSYQDKFADIARSIRSNFFSMDIAQTENDDWTIIEIGDGQVSGLGENANIKDFYKKIKII